MKLPSMKNGCAVERISTTEPEDTKDPTLNERCEVNKEDKPEMGEKGERSVYNGARISRMLLAVYGDRRYRRKLIIHLDIRNTILVADSVTDVSVEEALNSYLTGVVWGKEQDGEWKFFSKEPSLRAPAPGLCTYYRYLERQLVKIPTNRAELQHQTGDFVHTPKGEQFLEHFNKHLELLRWTYGNETSHHKVLTMSGRDGKPYHYILPSVYKLISSLHERQRDFAIVIRTFGRDASNVLSSLQYGLHGNHPAVPKKINLQVHKTPGLVKRGKNNIELVSYKPGGGQEIQTKLVHEKDIYRSLCDAQGITGYVDDFRFWQNKHYDHEAGKPFWIDLNDQRHHHIFFDDNFRPDEEDSIIDVRMFSVEAPSVAVSLDHELVAKLENVCLVQADLLKSIKDEDYFIRMTNECEEKFYDMFDSGQD